VRGPPPPGRTGRSRAAAGGVRGHHRLRGLTPPPAGRERPPRPAAREGRRVADVSATSQEAREAGAAPAGASDGARPLVCPAYAGYDFGDDHPLTPRRLVVGLDLLRASGLLGPGDEVCPPPAGDAELRLVHTPAYVEALARLSRWAPLLE